MKLSDGSLVGTENHTDTQSDNENENDNDNDNSLGCPDDPADGSESDRCRADVCAGPACRAGGAGEPGLQ